jgi:hypothetical protein
MGWYVNPGGSPGIFPNVKSVYQLFHGIHIVILDTEFLMVDLFPMIRI